MKPQPATLELERIRRMAECWRENVPSDFEVEMARCRLKAKSAAVKDVSRTSHAVVLGALLALSSLVPVMQGRAPELNAPSSGLDEQTVNSASRKIAATHPPPVIARAALVESAPAPVARAKQASRPARRQARSSVRRHPASIAERQGVAVTTPEVSFAHVADAGFRPDPLTRDVAALSRAYLLVSDGRAERARSMLERLADRGATSGIRRRANELLMRASEPPPSSLLFILQRSNGLG